MCAEAFPKVLTFEFGSVFTRDSQKHGKPPKIPAQNRGAPLFLINDHVIPGTRRFGP